MRAVDGRMVVHRQRLSRNLRCQLSADIINEAAVSKIRHVASTGEMQINVLPKGK